MIFNECEFLAGLKTKFSFSHAPVLSNSYVKYFFELQTLNIVCF